MKSLKDELKYQQNNLEEKLNNSYEEALKDASFYDLVSKLSFHKKKLIKYTSSLEECAKEYQNCSNCKSILECQNKMRGFAYLPCVHGESLSFEYQTCKYKKQLEEQTKYKKNMDGV